MSNYPTLDEYLGTRPESIEEWRERTGAPYRVWNHQVDQLHRNWKNRAFGWILTMDQAIQDRAQWPPQHIIDTHPQLVALAWHVVYEAQVKAITANSVGDAGGV